MFEKVKSKFGFYSASPLPTTKELTDHYSAQYYLNPTNSTYQQNYTQDELKHRKMRAELSLHAISKVIDSCEGKSLFEIGFGEGYILQAAHDRGMQIAGVDFTDAGLKTMHPELRSKVDVADAYAHIDTLIEKNETFDICVIQNVLEHVIDPSAMIERMKSILKPNGLAVINVPNDYSDLQMKALEQGHIEKEFWFGPIEHLHYFNTENLPDFVKSHDFTIMDAYGDFPIDLYLMHPGSNYIKNKENGKPAHNARITTDLLLAEKGIGAYHKFCQALSSVGIGRNICLIARKNGA